MSDQVAFNYVWRMTSYCNGEIANFIECADNIKPQELQARYVMFLESFPPKKSELVDRDVLELFLGDINNRAQIDYREGHWDDEPKVMAGGKRFDKRWRDLIAIHQGEPLVSEDGIGRPAF